MDFERGAHDGHLYRTWSERSAVVLPFVRGGLRNGEHTIIVTSPSSCDQWRRELEAFGVDVAHEESRGALQFVGGEVWREPAAVNSIVMTRHALDTVNPLLEEFKGVRMVGDAEWDLEPAVPPDKVCHWEATANLVFADSDVRAICQYDVGRIDARYLHASIRTHPSLIWGGKRYRNPHYEALRILEHEPYLNESTADGDMVDEMLRQLVGAADTNGRHNGHTAAHA
jgi:MEDS: MEthanogen/methylotroph, DcmR Sensory domain